MPCASVCLFFMQWFQVTARSTNQTAEAQMRSERQISRGRTHLESSRGMQEVSKNWKLGERTGDWRTKKESQMQLHFLNDLSGF